MKSLYTILFSVLFSSFVFAQQDNVIDKEAKRLEILCRKNSRIPDSLFFYGQQLLNHGKTHKHLKATIEGYFALGFSSSLKSKPDLAITYLDSAITYKKEASTQYFSEMMRIMRNKAIILSDKNEYKAAEAIYKEIVTSCKANNKLSDAAYVYNNLGIIRKDQGDYKTALNYYDDALKIWDSLGKDAPKTTLYMNIGLAQLNLQNYKQSNLSYYKGLAIAKTYKNNRDIYKFYNNLSINHRDLKQWDSAFFYLNKLTKHYKKNGLTFDEHLGYMNIGNTHYQKGNIDSAYFYLNKSVKGIKEAQRLKSLAENYRLLSYVYLDKKNPDIALKYIDSAYQINNDRNIKSTLARDYKQYAKIYEYLNDFKKANHYLKLEKQINDSLYQAQTAKDYNELLVKQDVKQKDKSIKDLSKDKTFYKTNVFITLFIIVIAFVLLSIIFKKYKNGKKEIAQLQEVLNTHNAQHQTKKADYITLKSGAVIDTHTILFIKSDGHYVEIFTEGKNKPEIERSTLTNFIDILPSKDFIRTHKSYVANIHKIKIINATQLMLTNGEWIKLSRTYKQQLKNVLNKS